MYIDTHCHLTFEHFNSDRAAVIGNAKKAGVKHMVCIGVDPMSCRKTIELAAQNPSVIFAGIGYHPYEASHYPDLTVIERFIKTDKEYLVAIGECGLDYHLFKGEAATGKKQEQRILFEEQLQLASKHGLPVVMHVREAYEDFFDIIDAQPDIPRGVIHCFSGGLQELREAQRRHFFVGIDGNITYSKQLQMIAPHIPLSMILLETDAPYLTPVPHRGTRNEPKYIPRIAAEVSHLLSVPLSDVERQTTQNAKQLFGVI